MVLRSLILLTLFSCTDYCFAQTESIDRIVNAFDSFQSKNLQEKIFVHTDRNSYLTGEALWLKVYCTEANGNKPLALSKVAYIELMDSGNKAILQSKIELSDGFGSGSFYLPASINTGNYVLRAYTSWMKNFDEALYFHQQISVINPFRNNDGENGSTLKKSDSETLNISFFPEGGNLVINQLSNVAFKITNRNSVGINASGIILENGRDTVLHFSSHKFGMGSFVFTPKDLHTYEAIIYSGKQASKRIKLPGVERTGYTLQLDGSNVNNINVFVQNNSSDGKTVYLVAHAKSKIVASKMNTLKDGKTQFGFIKDQLPEGLTQFTLFDEVGAPVCERFYFKKSTATPQITATTEKQNYFTRSKISLEIDTKDIGSASPFNASISVRTVDTLINNSTPNIRSYLELFSELKGFVDNPEYYVSNESDETNRVIDLLTLINGYSRYSWQSILKKDSLPILFLPEIRGHLIQGKIKNKVNDRPIPNITTILGNSSKIVRSYISKSNTAGTIYFEMKDFFDSQKIFVQTFGNKNDSVNVQIEDSFSSTLSSFKPTTLDLKPTLESYLTQRSIEMQSQNIYQANFVGLPLHKKVDSLNFYGKADEDYLLDDYTRFKSMEEIFREYVPSVIVKKKNESFSLMVINMPKVRLFANPPLILYDGVPIVNVDKIMAVDPLKIKRLEVISRPYYIGSLTADGIISLTSYKGSFEGIEIDPSTIVLDHEGLQSRREFCSPDYSTAAAVQSRLADFRDLLYWNPNITVEKAGKNNLEFYSSDKTGKYEIDIQGITKDGKAISARSYFSVIK